MGTLSNSIKDLLWGKVKDTSRYTRSVIANGNTVVFSEFGNRITASDIVSVAIHRVAEAVSKCELESVRESQNPHKVERVDDSINEVLKSRVNELCNAKDFLYKVTYLLLTNENAFIYWKYREEPIVGEDGLPTKYVKRITEGFYPIEAANVRIYMQNDEMRIELANSDKSVIMDCPYGDVIHIRHNYGANPYLGGDARGKRDNKDLLTNLRTMHVIRESIPKSLEASLSLKGVLSMKTIADVDKKNVTREEFENHLFDSKYGIVATDYESDFTPINVNATDIPSNTLNFLRDEILAPFGVSLPIYQGKYTDAEYTAFYQTAVEGILIEITQAMTNVLFTPRQLAYGHRIKFYDKLVQSLSFETRMKIAFEAKDNALLTRNEQRELLGYAPDDYPDVISLNYIDRDIANEYQLSTLKIKTNENNDEGKEEEDNG